MTGLFGQFMNTLGMEYESIFVDRETATAYVREELPGLIGDAYRHVNIVRDASVEFNAELIKVGNSLLRFNMHTSAHKFLPGRGRNGARVMGFEAVINPLTMDEFPRVIFPLFGVFKSHGDFTSHRASIHFHVGFANNLNLLKNMLTIALHLEPVFYRLGGMGGTHRGYINNFNYCRPLLNSAVVPVAPSSQRDMRESIPDRVPRTLEELREYGKEKRRKSNAAYSSGNAWVKISNPLQALKAETIQRFWASFGIECNNQPSFKYHPVRYSGWNFFSVFAHGTMEARHFNQSLDANLVVATAKLVRASIELSQHLSKRELSMFETVNPFEQISVGNAVESIQRVISFCEQKEVEYLPTEREQKLLYETIEKSKVLPIPQDSVKTHILAQHSFLLDPYLVELGKLEYVENPKEAVFTDIHNISTQEKSLYDSED